jgi:hypothetical protein
MLKCGFIDLNRVGALLGMARTNEVPPGTHKGSEGESENL